MNLRIKHAVPVLILAAGWSLLPPSSFAIQRYTTVTKMQCAYCHVSMVNKLKLTEAGEYYRQHHTFDGYQPKQSGGQQSPAKKQDQGH